MSEFKVGAYLEVGIGESIYDEDGCSYFFKMDKEGYDEYDVIKTFSNKGNILYITETYDESDIAFAGEAKFSDFL